MNLFRTKHVSDSAWPRKGGEKDEQASGRPPKEMASRKNQTAQLNFLKSYLTLHIHGEEVSSLE